MQLPELSHQPAARGVAGASASVAARGACSSRRSGRRTCSGGVIVISAQGRPPASLTHQHDTTRIRHADNSIRSARQKSLLRVNEKNTEPLLEEAETADATTDVADNTPGLSPEEERNREACAEELASRRNMRELGLTLAVGVMGAGLALTPLLDGVAMPSSLQAAVGFSGASMCAAVVLPRLTGDWGVQLGSLAFVECVNSRFYAQPGTKPTSGAAVQQGAIVVRPTGDARGRGAFATVPIAKDTMVVEYKGDLLNNKAFYMRYPDGVSDYCMTLDAETVVDAINICKGNEFAGGHVNHSRLRHNLKRWYNRRERRIWYFASRDIQAGEELLIDYGRLYWQGREHLEMD